MKSDRYRLTVFGIDHCGTEVFPKVLFVVFQ